MPTSSAVNGAAITKDELLAYARNIKSRCSSEMDNPYKRDVSDINEIFIRNLETRDEANLGDMKAAIEAESAAARKVARKAFLGGAALAAGGWLLPGLLGVPLPAPVKIGMIAGGFFLLSSVSGKAARAADAGDAFNRRLDDFGRAMTHTAPPQEAPKADAA